MNLITKAKIFGVAQCYMYTIEWQKRGLPHAHILVWLQEALHVHKVDDFISAEIPNPEEDPELFNCITTQMVHGPCGVINPFSPCMKNGRCTKRYLRDFLKETQTGRDGYPLYRRRRPEDGGFSTVISIRHSEVVVDNRWTVPYCPLLSRMFCAHINVEYCNSIKSIKYVCKYINKGSDMAVFDVTSSDGIARNEVNQYEMGRYISSNEAVWRILNFPIHERHPTVIHLSVHLENGQRVYFTEGNAAERALFAPETTLTAFFRLCNEDEFARTLFYHQVPSSIHLG
ncbi:helitron_like_N domain-containing protein [Trichonephila clavata]|uniref:Helitron_like_N domain-containing protein n=1 Tax=Trichonephila clavata TaxID=2740835 RepID=A0A8X6KEF5_TRICU|nr:helitron_like_N domain-containing protein [Trichonephila clavata]